MAKSERRNPTRLWLSEHPAVVAAFAEQSRTRGLAMRRGDQVRLLKRRGSEIVGEVRDANWGTHIALVCWDAPRRTLELFCSCDQALTHERGCEHTWAVLVEAEVSGEIPRRVLPAQLVVEFDAKRLDDDYDDDLDDDDEEFDYDDLDDDDDGPSVGESGPLNGYALYGSATPSHIGSVLGTALGFGPQGRLSGAGTGKHALALAGRAAPFDAGPGSEVALRSEAEPSLTKVWGPQGGAGGTQSAASVALLSATLARRSLDQLLSASGRPVSGFGSNQWPVCALLTNPRSDLAFNPWDALMGVEAVYISLVVAGPAGEVYPIVPEHQLDRQDLDPLTAELLVRGLRQNRWDPAPSRSDYGHQARKPPASIRLFSEEAGPLLERLLRAQRLYYQPESGMATALRWPGTGHAELCVNVSLDGTRYQLDGSVRVGEYEIPRDAWTLANAAGLLVAGDEAVVLPPGSGEWASFFLESMGESLAVAADEFESFLDRFHSLEDAPRLVLPSGLEFRDATAEPAPFIDIGAPDGGSAGLPVRVGVRYGEREVSVHKDPGRFVHDLVNRTRHQRARERELELLGTAEALGVRAYQTSSRPGESAPQHRLGRKRVPEVAQKLIEAGWTVSVERQRYSRAREFNIQATSGIDWLELRGTVVLDDREIPLGELVRALRRRNREDNFVELEGGTTAVVPQAWLDRLEHLAALERAERRGGDGDGVSLARAHAGAVLAVLGAADSSTEDADFSDLRRALERGRLPAPAKAPRGFRGELRDYQAHGLGWLRWLGEVGFGGCLADDMGLGKTVQVLAFLIGRKRVKQPSLVVAPRSVVPNWAEEAARFAPALAPTIHLGKGRATDAAELRPQRLIVTTYATLLKDLLLFQAIEFDCLVLDEAQAVKNPNGQGAAAVRTLAARQRLALTGTPVENHLGELWSLLDFLNPGFGKHIPVRSSQLEEAERQLVQSLIRPFILRRTKRQVATELPERVEQTIKVELSPAELRRYRELHDHFRLEYSEAVARLGVQRSTPKLLTGLLRLRQAACHQGLLDSKRRSHRSSKLDVLLERLTELADEKAKALVFSQFTSHLDIVEAHLAKTGIRSVRLDGSTKNRVDPVKAFQEDPSVGVFLISLKAGGTGLNLTAAEYVFLLDPWWNPAVEAQAIDRAHRIGQTSTVIAYRLIASGTIEEKVAELQARKRALVDSVFGDESAFLGKLTRDELLALLD